MLNLNKENSIYTFSEKDETAIKALTEQKYATEDWNYYGNYNKAKAHFIPLD